MWGRRRGRVWGQWCATRQGPAPTLAPSLTSGVNRPRPCSVSAAITGKCVKDKNTPLTFYIKHKNHLAGLHTDQLTPWPVALRATLQSPSSLCLGHLRPRAPSFRTGWGGVPSWGEGLLLWGVLHPLPGTLPRVPTEATSAELLGPHMGPRTGCSPHTARDLCSESQSSRSIFTTPAHSRPLPPEGPGGLPCAKPCRGASACPLSVR